MKRYVLLLPLLIAAAGCHKKPPPPPPPHVGVVTAATVPIAIASNFVRVLALVLLAFYGGVDALQGGLHELTGFALFAIAVALFCLFDATLGVVIARMRRSGVRA